MFNQEEIKEITDNLEGWAEELRKDQHPATLTLLRARNLIRELLNTANKISTTETLFDNKKNRDKYDFMEKIEIMADDEQNPDYESFWVKLDDFLKWGKTYKITIEEK